MSVPARWRELYFNVFSILCIFGEIFLIWHEIYRRDSSSDFLDIIMNILLDTGPVAMAAAIAAFITLKGRDAMLSTWETFAKRRYDKGREEGREEGLEEGREESREERETMAKQIQELQRELSELKNANGTTQC